MRFIAATVSWLWICSKAIKGHFCHCALRTCLRILSRLWAQHMTGNRKVPTPSIKGWQNRSTESQAEISCQTEILTPVLQGFHLWWCFLVWVWIAFHKPRPSTSCRPNMRHQKRGLLQSKTKEHGIFKHLLTVAEHSTQVASGLTSEHWS